MSNNKYPTRDVEVTLSVPIDYSFDREEKEWVMHLFEKAAERGSRLEDAAAVEIHAREKKARISGAKDAQQFLLALAGRAFGEGRDRDAEFLRNAAREMDTLLLQLHKDQKEHEHLFVLTPQQEVRDRRRSLIQTPPPRERE